jgi:signal transduction histidine kinase
MRASLSNYLSDPRELREASHVFQREVEAAGVRLMGFAALAAGITALAVTITRLIIGAEGVTFASGPAVVAVIFAWQAVTGARLMGWAMIGASVAVVIGFNLTGTSETLLPSALVLVLLGSAGILLRDPGMLVVAVSNSALMVIAGLTWVEDGPDRAALLGTMLGGFVVMGFVMWVVRFAGTVAIARYLRLFEENPVALIEQDWTGVAKAAAELGFEDLDELRIHLQSHPDLVADLAHEAVYTRANRAAAELAGTTDPSQMLGPFPRERVNETSMDAMIEQIVAVCAESPKFEIAYQTLTYSGEPIWVEVRWIRPPPLGAARGIIVTAIRDITEEVNAREASTELIREKDEFIASVSHELRTPLTAVVGLAGELEYAYGNIPEPERIELIGLINSQSREMAAIVEDLLVAARADIGQISIVPEPTNLTENVDHVVREFGWADSIARPRGECSVVADPVRLRQILRNLIANAHRYGGGERRITGGRFGDTVEIEIRDNGPGVPTDERDRIFEPYARAHSLPGITASVGLGLAVSRRLARLMDGDIIYEYDGGSSESVFRLTLPAAASGKPESCS